MQARFAAGVERGKRNVLLGKAFGDGGGGGRGDGGVGGLDFTDPALALFDAASVTVRYEIYIDNGWDLTGRDVELGGARLVRGCEVG